jgi:hypothetical protein
MVQRIQLQFTAPTLGYSQVTVAPAPRYLKSPVFKGTWTQMWNGQEDTHIYTKLKKKKKRKQKQTITEEKKSVCVCVCVCVYEEVFLHYMNKKNFKHLPILCIFPNYNHIENKFNICKCLWEVPIHKAHSLHT